MIVRSFFAVFLTIFGLVAQGEPAYQCDFQPEQLAGWKLPSFAAIEKDGNRDVLKVTIPATQPGKQFFVSRAMDLTPYRGKILIFSCKAKAEGVTKPAARYNGVKFMLHFRTEGAEKWYHPNDLSGTFDWKEITFTAKIPDDVTGGDLSLGLQDSSGTVWFSEIKANLFDDSALYPKIALPDNFKAEYTDRVKNMPPLRGVMSPTAFRSGDLEELAKWKANLIRWQLVRAWGKAGTDRDKTEYSQWIDHKIAELDKLLVDTQRLGIKVIIDLHSPPGGRYVDRNMAMNYEPEYADQFIEVWQRIATHFKGNPGVWAYDLINEPVQTKPAKTDYLTLQFNAAKAIRAIDPDMPIIIESNLWDSPDTFSYLSPLPLKNIIYQVHVYMPGAFTHQNVRNNWGETSAEVKSVVYPGQIDGENFNRDTIRKHLRPVIAFQKKYGVRIYVGEFSAIRWAPGAAQYLDDCTSIFEENGWDWSYHAFREWSGWSVEHSSDPHDNNPVTQDTDRKKVLLKCFEKNQRQ